MNLLELLPELVEYIVGPLMINNVTATVLAITCKTTRKLVIGRIIPKKDICTCAAENGHNKVLQWARQNGCPWNAWTCAYAAKNGHLEVLKWTR